MSDPTTSELIERTRDRDLVVKAYTIGPDRLTIEKRDDDGNDAAIGLDALGDVLDPPYDPTALCRVFEHSSSLRQNIDAYKTNIDGFGHVFEPVIQLKESSARELVADAILLERSSAASEGKPGSTALLDEDPNDEDIKERIRLLRHQMRIEKAQIESFFGSCVAEESFVSLRQRTREEREVTGNGYWEVLRNLQGKVSQFAYMPCRSMRALKKKGPEVEVSQEVRTSLLSFRTEKYRRRFRRYIQRNGDESRYFKEFGDPTVVSSKTGKSFAKLEQLQKVEPDVAPANEVIHWRVNSLTNTTYGVPRWIGNLLSVLGSRSAEEVNLSYFDNKSVPPLAILVSGGRLGQDSVKRIEDFVETQLKGRGSFHKILVIEAETSIGALGISENAGAMRVEIKMLTDAQLKDGLFLAYDAANMDKVGMGFRLPRLLRGDIRDFNRASAEAALDFAESQVFVPERNDFDFVMNRFILPSLGIRYWSFRSNGPRLSDAQSWGDMIAKLVNAGILTPADARELTSKKVLSQELPLIEADWTRQPLALTIAGIPADTTLDGTIPVAEEPSTAPPTDQGVKPAPSLVAAAKKRLLAKAKSLLALRDEFFRAEAQKALEEYKTERADDSEVTYTMTAAEMESLFNIKKAS